MNFVLSIHSNLSKRLSSQEHRLGLLGNIMVALMASGASGTSDTSGTSGWLMKLMSAWVTCTMTLDPVGSTVSYELIKKERQS